MSKGSLKSASIDELIYKIKRGADAEPKKPEKKVDEDARHDGPAKHSYPRKKDMEKLIDYAELDYPVRKPNKVKLGIEEGEDRFPAEAKVPNYKKYDKSGNYIKHKVPTKSKEEKPGASTSEVVRRSLLSNPMTRRGKKTVA
jgi:hypothetical protein